MLETLILLLGLTAVIAWIVAVYSGLSVVRLAPAGGRLQTLTDIGLWRFDVVRHVVGTAATPHLGRYVPAFLAFVLAVVLLAALAAVSAATRVPVATPGQAAGVAPITSVTSSLES